MNLLSEASNGALPILKVYDYADRWQISNWEWFGDVISTSHDHFRSELDDVMNQEADKGKK